MTIEYNWKVIQMERTSDHNAVIVVHWDCTGTDSESGVTHRSYGAQGLEPDPSSPDFVPFDSLTENTVLEWLWNSETGVDKLQVESRIAVAIQEQLSPTVITGLPW